MDRKRRDMIYKIGVHPLSHALEWKSGGVSGFLSLPLTDYKCPHCVLIEYEGV